MGDYKTNIN